MKTNKLLLVAVLAAAGVLASCGNKPVSSNNGGNSSEGSQSGSSEVAKSSISLGLGYSSSFEGMNHYGNLANQFTVNAAAVGFDADGKIVVARFDSIQINQQYVDGTYSAKDSNKVEGKVASKLELGVKYNMKGVSAIGLEVDDQIENFAKWCVGKTVAQVTALEDASSVEGCSISISMYQEAVQVAYNHKRAAVEYTGNVYAGVGMDGDFSYTHSGDIESSCAIAGALVGDDNKVLASWSDDVVIDFQKGEGTAPSLTDAGEFKVLENKYIDSTTKKCISKWDLHSDYKMKEFGPTHFAEWDEQAQAFDAYIVGKTATEIKALSEVTGVTITLNGFVNAAAEAATYAKMEHIGPRA